MKSNKILKQLVKSFKRKTSLEVEGDMIFGDYGIYIYQHLAPAELIKIGNFINDVLPYESYVNNGVLPYAPYHKNPRNGATTLVTLGVSINGTLELRFSNNLFNE